VPPSHPLLGDGIKADDLLIEIASWLTTAEFASKAAERRLRRACLRRAVYVVVACNRLERAVAERKIASNNCLSSTAVGGPAAAEAVPPSHPLLGDGIKADDLLIEIASWLTAAECRALAACRLRFHALASWTELLLPWRWVRRGTFFAPLLPSLHARRWQLPMRRWRERAMARAQHLTIEMHFRRSDSDGEQPFVVPAHAPEAVTHLPSNIIHTSSLWFKIRRRTRVSRLASYAEDLFHSLELWPDSISIELSRSDGSTLGLFGPGDARESWAEPDATPRSVVGPRFPLDITADEKLVLVAHFG